MNPLNNTAPSTTTNINTNGNDIHTLDDQALEKKKQQAISQENYDLAGLIKKEQERRISEQGLEHIDVSGKSPEEIKKLALEEIKKYRAKADEKDKEVTNNQSEIERLKREQLELLTDIPSLKDYFSREGRRNSDILNHIQTYKTTDKANYPKNFLQYAMGLTETKILGVRQAFKRGWAKLTREDKYINIKEILEILIKRCQLTGKESKFQKAMKEALLKEAREAKDARIEIIKKQNSF